jgi:molybdenum transport protein
MIYFTDAELDLLINEDLPYYDITSLSVKLGAKVARISFTTTESTVICGIEEALKIFEKFKINPTLLSFSGEHIDGGIKFLEGEGLANNVHAISRTVLNLMEYASGIATRTKSLVEEAQQVKPGIPIVTTRKSIPFTKKITVKAVSIGGGHIHRLGLSDNILIFDNHLKFLGGIENFESKLPEIRKRVAGRKITVVVKSAEDALNMAKTGIDAMQVDKMSAADLTKLITEIRKINPTLDIAASAYIDMNNVAAYAASGANQLVTSSPYYGRPSEFLLNIEPVFDI